MSEELGKRVLDVLARSVDARALGEAVARLGPASPAPAAAPGDATARAVLRKIVLSDLLDDAILGARPGESSYPLRMFFAALGDELDGEVSFALASGINFYFRAPMDEEPKLAIALEVSRLYYRFAQERPLEPELVRALSPLLARLMSTELSQVRLESVDHAKVFDSATHERALGSDASSAKILAPKSFLCRVVANDRVRVKATVRT